MKHLMLDIYGCPAEVLSDEASLRQTLETYPQVITMEQVSPVVLEDISTTNPLDAGLSGFVIIATSHVSLHAWPAYGMVNLDIFSCEPFSTSDVISFACQQFHSRDIEVHCVERAIRSPRLSNRPLHMHDIQSHGEEDV